MAHIVMATIIGKSVFWLEFSSTGVSVECVVIGGDVGSKMIDDKKFNNFSSTPYSFILIFHSLNVRPITIILNSEAVNSEKLWILNS